MAIEPSASETNGSEEYGVIPARGQEIHVDRGETFANKLIDLSTGDSICLRVTGSNSVIRNVGFEGCYRGGRFLLWIDGDPGDVLVENVYMGDGARRDGTSVRGPGGVFLHHGNEADVRLHRCNVQGFPNNGFHCSNTAAGAGSVHFDRCFGKNNGVATFRCGGGEDLIEHCVAYTDGTDYGHDDDEYLETNGRPVWVWNGGTVTIRDSHFADGPYPNAVVAGANDAPGRISFESGGYRGPIQRTCGSTVDVSPAVSDDADLSIPDGVPTSAKAASGGFGRPSDRRRVDTDVDLPHSIVFAAGGSGEPSAYAFEADAVVTAGHHDARISDGYGGHRAVQGVVDDTVEAYWFRGNLESLSVDGDATVSIQYDVRDGGRHGGPIQS
ncbi:Protein containing parallel beta helix region [Halorhabdus sp. SVX81]|uniref:hypothetical protein n=1 Tax=Halorhabdus sp. SVX81 TaxID=2978283 RepID=UPI0023DAE671|nr:hypothetical protein [Halorhabdus sp. SVX81]WEL18806.1 Protein containing parallel beta helix region [Halorhabdus sp. SVX81]